MFDIHQDLHNEYDDIDEGRVREYIEELVEEFAVSPEWQSVRETCGNVYWAVAMMEYANDFIGCTPRDMELSDFNEVLFKIFPRKVSVEAEEAATIIAELRAFWSFAARQYELENARKIVESLDDHAVSRLHEKLSDPANFGMAKSFFMLGSEAGFDMTTQEGLAAFQAVFNANLLRNRPELNQLDQQLAKATFELPVPERRGGDELKKKRKEKRRQREAKRRNRPH